MEDMMNTKKLITTFVSIVTVIAFALGAFLLSPTAAQAAPALQEGTPLPFADGSRLELACRERGRMLEGQQDRIDYAKRVAAKAQEWIDYLKGEGKDTAPLETALASFNTSLGNAQAKHDEGQAAYDTQAGFDGNCKLVDREQAKITLQTINDALRQAHRYLVDATIAFHRAVQAWRIANRP
jgi:hypothetical protein